MATYNDKFKTVIVHTMLTDEGRNYNATDTAENRAGSMAVADFKAGRDIVVKTKMMGVDTVVTIPYDAVEYLEVVETNFETAKDPYGCNIIVSFITSDVGQPTFPPIEANADGQITLPGGDEQSKPIFYEDAEKTTQVGVGGDVITVTENTTLYYTYSQQ